MELDIFIAETLKSIVKGVKDSQSFAQEHGARVNPIRMDRNYKGDFVFYGNEEGIRTVSKIDFDVAVTVSSKQESGASGGIKVFALNIGGKLSDADLHESVSRIKFSVDVALPNIKS